MGWWLADTDAAARAQGQGAFVKRFDPRFWTVNFPRPLVAAVTTTAPDALRVDAVFYKHDDLAGLIWEAEDSLDHPLARYETARDFRGCRLSFRWRSGGVRALDTTDGPTLTIEGRDETGAARAWYVRLWNFASGSPEDAAISLDFDDLTGGFSWPIDADPVWAGDVDRMFISLVPLGYDRTPSPLDEPAEGWATLDAIRCDGRSSVLAISDALVPAHDLRIATGYDDLYNQTPARVVRTIRNLGYRGLVNHYVGMSHWFRLAWDESAGAFLVSAAGWQLNVAAEAWHRSFAAALAEGGYDLIQSISFELLDQHCFGDWKQRAADGSPALTGWDPPSTLLSPAHDGAMHYLRASAAAFAGIAASAGLRVRVQVGEPWWWQVPGTGSLCLYDAATAAALGDALVPIADVRQPLDEAQLACLDRAGALLSAATAGIAEAVRAVAADAQLLLLVYLPTVLAPDAPELRRANVPLGWRAPAFDVLQLEDYDWAAAGDVGASARGQQALIERLGYPPDVQHYFAGYVPSAADAGDWAAIAAAADAAEGRGVAERFIWALPQVTRDGFTHFDLGDTEMQPFDDVAFPLALGLHAEVSPTFSTAIVTTGAGTEQRNANWADARLSFDVGPGVRSEADLQTLVAFFRARRGSARGFRFTDPFDNSSAGMTDTPGAGDQTLGIGDGATTRFALVKRYGEDDPQVRRITRPVAGSVRVSVAGVEQAGGWSLEEGGVVAFQIPPAAGAVVEAGFRFDVPVRFAEDRLDVSATTFRAGEVPSVPLVEIKEGVA